MESRSEQMPSCPGQHEVCTVFHNGHEFTASGAVVNGRNVTGYLKVRKLPPLRMRSQTEYALTNWKGQTLMECRAEIVQKYRPTEFNDETFSIMFSLTHGRYIVGYALGEGSLFRGELIEADSPKEAREVADATAHYWIERDQEDEESFRQECQDEDADNE